MSEFEILCVLWKNSIIVLRHRAIRAIPLTGAKFVKFILRLNEPFNDPETFKTILSQWLWQSVSISSRHGPSCQASMGLFQEQAAFSFPHACQSLTVMTALCLTSHSHLGAGHLPPERCLNSKFTTMRHDPISIVWLSLTRSSSRVPTLNWNNLNGNQSCSQYRSISCQQFSCL